MKCLMIKKGKSIKKLRCSHTQCDTLYMIYCIYILYILRIQFMSIITVKITTYHVKRSEYEDLIVKDKQLINEELL